MGRRIGWLVLALVFSCLYALPSYAEESPKNKGLFVTPVREYVDVAPGRTKDGKLTIANFTDKPATVTLSVEQFSVADYTYDYRFTPVEEDWVKFQATSLELQPGKSQAIAYAVDAPPNATPGGHYFSLFATVSKGANKVRAATVLYVTVGGLLQRTSEIRHEAVPWISWGGDIPFRLDVKDTGNTHFFAFASGKLDGWTAGTTSAEVTHLLLPGAIRSVGSSMPAPLLPGVYQASYGYKTDTGESVFRTRHIVYLPPWALLIPCGLVLGVVVWRRKRAL